MTTIFIRHSLITLGFAACLFLGMSASVLAQTCTRNGPGAGGCTPPKICFVPLGKTQGTCQNPPTNTSDPTSPGPTSGVTSGGTSAGGQGLINPLKVNSLEGLLGLIIDAAVRLGTIVLVLALVYVGFLFVAARGQEEKIRDARRYFFWIVIGGLLVLGAKGLSEVIKATANTLGTGT